MRLCLAHAVVCTSLQLSPRFYPAAKSTRSMICMKHSIGAPADVTPDILAKRAERAKKRAAQQTPEAIAAAEAASLQEAERKREARRQRDADDAEALRAWSICDENSEQCALVDIGANLVKVKDDEALERQLQRASSTGVTRIIVTGTSVVSSRRALELVRAARGTVPSVQLYCTAGVHPHDARTCNEQTLTELRELLSAPECVAVGECGLDYDRMFSPREVQLEWFAAQVL